MGVPSGYHCLTQIHWKLSHLPKPGFLPGRWWETASSPWQCLRPLGHLGRPPALMAMPNKTKAQLLAQTKSLLQLDSHFIQLWWLWKMAIELLLRWFSRKHWLCKQLCLWCQMLTWCQSFIQQSLSLLYDVALALMHSTLSVFDIHSFTNQYKINGIFSLTWKWQYLITLWDSD